MPCSWQLSFQHAVTSGSCTCRDVVANTVFLILEFCNAGEVSTLAGRADLGSIAERPDVMQRVTALLECLRGAAQGNSSDAQQPLFGVCASVMEPLLVLQRAYREHEPIVCLLLKLAGDMVEAHVSYLSVSL